MNTRTNPNDKKISITPFPFHLENKNNILHLSTENFIIERNVPQAIKNYIIKAKFTLSEKSTLSAGTENFLIKQKKTESLNNLSLTKKDSYILNISESSIEIYYFHEEGFFYSLITLAQLLMTYKKNLPCLFIYDKSEYSWRGFLLDTCRYFFSTEFIKKTIDLCAFHKMNILHWHLTDDQGWRLPVKKYSRLTEIGSVRKDHTMPESNDAYYDNLKETRSYYTEEEIKDIVKYAEERFVNVIPEVEFPGHASALLAAYPEYGCTKGPYKVQHAWGIFNDVLCLGNDKIFEIYDSILNTLDELFPSQYVHIGGDECPSVSWEKCPECKKRMEKENLKNSSQLQSWGTKKMVELVLKHKKIPLGWDEVLNNTDIIPLPKEIIVQSWQGEENGEKASELGHKVIMSPQTTCYLNLKNADSYEEPGRLGFTTTEKAYSYLPFTKKMNAKNRNLILGGECAFWAEKITASRNAEYMMFPRFCAISECLWLGEVNKNFDRFADSMEEHKKRLSLMNTIFYGGELK